MSKVRRHTFPWGEVHLHFNCPGCNCEHTVRIEPRDGEPRKTCWTYNDLDGAPTLSPSIMVDRDRPERRCHSFVENGKIKFCGDCHHDLKNQEVELPDYE